MITEHLRRAALVVGHSDVSGIDPEDYDVVAGALGINGKLVREIAYENDEYFRHDDGKSCRERYKYILNWCSRHIVLQPDELLPIQEPNDGN